MSLTERLKPGRELKKSKINSLNRQVIPKIYDTLGKKVGSNGTIAEVFEDLIKTNTTS